MIPLQNGSDYYKKMLELQERLRKSEEERIRLEERFSMLENESRSRHETCINRLRMRYIEFLEEQQARDERNHKLLGALDRVDTSLALMSAKTDRLGALRKQYEATILSSCNNRINGSMTGDSGVASQIDDKQRRNDSLNYGNKSSRFLLSDRVGDLTFEENKSTRKKNSFDKVRSDPSYANWSGSRYDNFQPISSARFSTGIMNKNSEPLASSINSLNSRKLRRSSIDRELTPQTSTHDYRFSSRFVPEYTIKKPESKNYLPDCREVQTGKTIRDLAQTDAYDTFAIPSRSFNENSGYSIFQPDRLAAAKLSASNLSRKDPEKSIVDSNSSNDNSIPAKKKLLTRVTDILRKELGDEEDYIGNVVENELEKYINKIRNLHREAEPQSVEEIDHEQNTSGDLLNVTLSDDGVDLSTEEKPKIRLPQNLENVLEIADDLAKRTATNGNKIFKDYHQEKIVEERIATGVDGSNDDRNSTSAVNELTSFNPRLGHDEDNENFSLLAKNGISTKISKYDAELATAKLRNIEDVTKNIRNNRDINNDKVETNKINDNYKNSTEFIIEENENQNIDEDKELFIEDSQVIKKLENEYKILVGKECETDDNLRDIYEEIEPWNLNALERRVQEIILKDEIQDDIKEIKNSELISQQEEKSKIFDTEFEAKNSNISTINTSDTMEILPEMKINENSEISEKSIDRLIENHKQESSEKIEIENRPDVNPIDYQVNDENYVQPEENFNEIEYPDNSNSQYEFTSNQQYQGDSNEYQNYDPNNVQYEEDPNAPQYSYDQQYQADYNENQNSQQFSQDENIQQEYSQDENIQQQFSQDENIQQQYTENSNAQHYENSNLQYENPNEEYLRDSPESYIPNADQEYSTDPNQQYVNDPNYDNYEIDPNQYATNIDPQEYQQNEIYQQQTEDVQYSVPNPDYVYPETQNYSNMEIYEPNVQPVNDAEKYFEETETSVYESENNFNDTDKNFVDENQIIEKNEMITIDEKNEKKDEKNTKKTKDVIKSILDSDTESTIEKNVSNTESDFDFN